jgi:hypothetical protein
MRWISIKDKKPEWGEWIIAYNPSLSQTQPIIITNVYIKEVSHWMPLVGAPKE